MKHPISLFFLCMVLASPGLVLGADSFISQAQPSPTPSKPSRTATKTICPVGDAASNWESEGINNLMSGGPEPVGKKMDAVTLREKAKGNLCVRKNNYWCQKNKPDVWIGTNGPGGCYANADKHAHAIFENAEYGARAGAQAIRSSFLKGRRSALAIAERRSPSCDTLGSKGLYPNSVNPVVGKSCSDGEQPPATWKGPLCPRIVSTSAQCVKGCNCPPKLAEVGVKEFTGLTINDDLPLFNETCEPQPSLIGYLQRQAFTETGLWPTEAVIRRGVALMGPIPKGGKCR